jgi:hypothetical protein
VLESDLRELFDLQAATELPPVPVSIPAARRIARARLVRRRAAAFGTPVLAAGAVVAVVLASLYAAGPGRPAIGSGVPVAPKLFNPLVPYATATWYPYRPTLVGVSDWHTALLLRASSRAPAQSTEVALYPAGWCTLRSSRLSCGSTAAGTRAELTVTGHAPDVQGHAAYWTRFAGGDLVALRPPSGGAEMVAFQYARGGWAVAESTGTLADVLRVASSLRYGQASPLRFPFRLTGLPSVWSEVLFAAFTRAEGAHATAAGALVLGSPATRPGTTARDALTLLASSRTEPSPHCRTSSAVVGHGPSGAASRPVPCPSTLIHGYRVYLNSPPVPGKQTLFTPDADGLYVYENTIGPDAPLSPAEVFAHHLELLGPNAANWTTTPSSGETVRLDHP